jgi:uncharacterized membrane protein YesL
VVAAVLLIAKVNSTWLILGGGVIGWRPACSAAELTLREVSAGCL